MSFWNNPENNSLKMLMVAVLVGAGGWFAYSNFNAGGTGRVINTAKVQNQADTAAMMPTQTATQEGLLFSVDITGKTCTTTITNVADKNQAIVVAGTLGEKGDCVPNVKQNNAISQGMATLLSGK